MSKQKQKTFFAHIMFSSCSPHVLSLEFSYTELVIQCTIYSHIVGYLVDARISASEKDLPVEGNTAFHYAFSTHTVTKLRSVAE